jgi:hypothetical protein
MPLRDKGRATLLAIELIRYVCGTKDKNMALDICRLGPGHHHASKASRINGHNLSKALRSEPINRSFGSYTLPVSDVNLNYPH